MSRLPSTIDHIKKMQADFRAMHFTDANHAMAANVIAEHYCSDAIEALENPPRRFSI